jgi:hypothetical protein
VSDDPYQWTPCPTCGSLVKKVEARVTWETIPDGPMRMRPPEYRAVGSCTELSPCGHFVTASMVTVFRGSKRMTRIDFEPVPVMI